MVETTQDADGLSRSSAQPTLLRRLLRKTIHRLSYHFILKRDRTTVAHAAGFRLTVRPTVFHPAYFLTSEFFAEFISRQDWAGSESQMSAPAPVSWRSPPLGLAPPTWRRSTSTPMPRGAADENAMANGLDGRVTAVCSNLLSAIAARPYFDVILSSSALFPGQPLDLADRAWHAGEYYRDIALLFGQARQRLAPGGRFYLLLSSDSDLKYLGTLVERAGFRWHVVAERSIVIESFILYELRAQ